MPKLPNNTPSLLRAAGLNVVEIDGWETRSRPPETGGFYPVGVLNHHRGSPDYDGNLADDLAYAKWLATVGRPDLPPPLSQFGLSHEGTVYMQAAGRSNHAGVAKPSGSVTGGDGNALYVGIEWFLSGTQPIPDKMYQAGVTLNAVLLHILGSSEQAVSCHYQTSVTGKWDIGDPDGIPFEDHKVLDVDEFRVNVKAASDKLYQKGSNVPVPVQVVKTVVLPGTIDGHKPLLVTFRIHGPNGWFRVHVITVNWGRGYAPGEFKRNVLAVLDAVNEKQYVVLLMQEIDEADAAHEHKVIAAEMEPGTTLVCWETREPIAVSPGVPVHREHKVMTMDAGQAIGAPAGTGPRRFFTSCLTTMGGLQIGFGNQHPHRVDPDWSHQEQKVVLNARAQGEQVTRDEVAKLVQRCDLTIYGGDMNDPHYPPAHHREKVAITHGLDTIRYVVG